MEKIIQLTSKGKEVSVKLQYFFGLDSSELLFETTEVALSCLDLYNSIVTFMERNKEDEKDRTLMDMFKLVTQEEVINVKTVMQTILKHPKLMKLVPKLIANVKVEWKDVGGEKRWFVLNKKENLNLIIRGNVKLLLEIAVHNWLYNYKDDFFGMGDGTEE